MIMVALEGMRKDVGEIKVVVGKLESEDNALRELLSIHTSTVDKALTTIEGIQRGLNAERTERAAAITAEATARAEADAALRAQVADLAGPVSVMRRLTFAVALSLLLAVSAALMTLSQQGT